MVIKLLKATIEKKALGVNELQLLFSFNGEVTPIAVDNSTASYREALEMLQEVDGNTDLEKFSWDLAHVVIPGRKLTALIAGEKILNENLKISGGKVLYQDTVMDNTLLSYIMSLLNSDDTPKDEKTWSALMNFIENLHQNVSPFVREQLFGWMKYEIEDGNAFAITEDGCFIGYRGVTGTITNPVSINTGTAFVDGVKHTGHIPNSIGSIVSMPRHQVEDNPEVGCAPGLHVGTWNYASGWTDKGLVLTVKVNPKNVVSVPTECDSQKIRVSEYQVLEVAYDPLSNLLYGSTDEEDEDWLDYDDMCWAHEEDDRVVFDDYTLERLDEALRTTESGDYVGGSIAVFYDDKSFAGSVIGYEDDRVILRDDYEYKTILAHRIEEISFYEDDEEDEVEEVNESFTLDELTLIEEAMSAFEDGNETKFIEVYYDGKYFVGYVIDYSHDRVIMKNDEDVYKTILAHRVEDIILIEAPKLTDDIFGHEEMSYDGVVDDLLLEFIIKELEKSIRGGALIKIITEQGDVITGIPISIEDFEGIPVLIINQKVIPVKDVASIETLSSLH